MAVGSRGLRILVWLTFAATSVCPFSASRAAELLCENLVLDKTVAVQPRSVQQEACSPSLPSEVARRIGVRYLMHGTYPGAIENILKEKLIMPKDLQENPEANSQGRTDRVYLEPFHGQTGSSYMMMFDPLIWRNMSNQRWRIKLIFDPKVLDGRRSFLSRGWPFGKLNKTSAYWNQTKKVKSIFHDLNTGALGAAELVLEDGKPVDLSNLVAIWVMPNDRPQVVTWIIKNNILPPGKSMDDFVVNYPDLDDWLRNSAH